MSDQAILSELARVKATFQLRAISAAIGIPPSAPPAPPAGAVHAASDSAPARHGKSPSAIEVSAWAEGSEL